MYSKDVLIVDFETTGFNTDTDEPVQLGYVLLDKDTLEEKDSFVTWINPKTELDEDIPGFKWAGITKEQFQNIESAPSLAEVAKIVKGKLPEEYTFCSWNVVFDYLFWKKTLSELKETPQTYHNIDLWTLAYYHLTKETDYSGSFGSEAVFQYFGLSARERHDALEDCRLEAEVLRKVTNA